MESQPDAGTTLRVYLPVSRTPVDETPQVEDAPAPVPWRGRGVVLFVDDEETVREVGVAMLQQMGFQVVEASNGSEAVEIATRRCQELACIVLERTMPGIEGMEALRQMRTAGCRAPVVISSGFDQRSELEAAIDPPPAAWLKKPFRLRDLAMILQEVTGEE